MVTGQSLWDSNWLIEVDGSSAKVWGKADIIVDGGLGTWQLSWHGWLTDGVFDAGSGFFGEGIIVVEAVGQGKSGQVKGLLAKWKYTMDFDGTPETLKYYIKGKIIE